MSVAFLAVVTSAASAATIVVDGSDTASDADGCGGGPGTAADPCNTIQAGVDAAAAGDTVSVAPGTYSEAVVVNKQLTLAGAQAGVDARSRQSGAESVVTGTGYQTTFKPPVEVAADHVMIDGFTFRPIEFGLGVFVDQSVKSPAIHNNVFEGDRGVTVLGGTEAVDVWQNDFRTGDWGIRTSDPSAGQPQINGATIESNAFAPQGYVAIEAIDVSDLNILDNTANRYFGGATLKWGNTSPRQRT